MACNADIFTSFLYCTTANIAATAITTTVLKLKKVKLSVCLIKHRAMKTYWGVEVWLNHSRPWHQLEVCGQLHAMASLTPGKKPLAPIG
jgi:hypothetical protein